MSIRQVKRPLEDVLNEYVATEHKPNHKELKRWIKQYLSISKS